MYVFFFVKDDDLLEKYNTISDKFRADIKREFDGKPVDNKEFLKTKIKSHGDEVTDFDNKTFPKMHSNHTCIAVISLDSALKRDEKYYLQEFYKYIEKKVIRHINENLSNFSSSDEYDEK